jgi:hypothetical protein
MLHILPHLLRSLGIVLCKRFFNFEILYTHKYLKCIEKLNDKQFKDSCYFSETVFMDG